MRLKSSGLFFLLKEASALISTLSGLEVETRLSEALLTKGRIILNFFQSQRLKWNKEIEHLLREFDTAEFNGHQFATTAIFSFIDEVLPRKRGPNKKGLNLQLG